MQRAPRATRKITIGSTNFPQTPRRRQRRRTSYRRGEGAATTCRWPHQPSAAARRNRNTLNKHGHSIRTPQPPSLQPTPHRLGPPPRTPHHLRAQLPSPPRPAGAETPTKNTTGTTCNQNGTRPSTRSSPRHLGRPEKHRRRTKPDRAPPQPPRQGRNGDRRGRTKPTPPTPSPPSRSRREDAHLVETYLYTTRTGAPPHLTVPKRRPEVEGSGGIAGEDQKLEVRLSVAYLYCRGRDKAERLEGRKN